MEMPKSCVSCSKRKGYMCMELYRGVGHADAICGVDVLEENQMRVITDIEGTLLVLSFPGSYLEIVVFDVKDMFLAQCRTGYSTECMLAVGYSDPNGASFDSDEHRRYVQEQLAVHVLEINLPTDGDEVSMLQYLYQLARLTNDVFNDSFDGGGCFKQAWVTAPANQCSMFRWATWFEGNIIDLATVCPYCKDAIEKDPKQPLAGTTHTFEEIRENCTCQCVRHDEICRRVQKLDQA